MSQPNTPLPTFIDRSTPSPTRGTGSQFALTPTKQRLPEPMIDLPSQGGIMGSNHDCLDRDLFSNNEVDEDSLLLRGGNLPDGAEAQFRPYGIVTVRPATLDGNHLRGGSIAVVGPQTSKDLNSTLTNRVQMAKVKAKLPDQDC
ncbi:unnamed protein product [Clonostachys byssicola]|uniref:Uncharacterized protein n=1 Tax=Clonostachys byssicola TaxID=160290 RepID=A0A9N9YCZ3_9HYPO|nr:unnamed protein product [Clonostachys byssicola]